MRSLARVILALALLALAPTAASAQVTETFRVPSVDGSKIWVEVTRPDGDAKVPVILTYSPYNALGGNSEDEFWTKFGPKGYARAVSDVLGVRNSTGCWDYGGLKEQQSGVDLVNFLASQPWSNGKVAMIGTSYDGTTATMVAAAGEKAPGLAAIVPIAAISRWYGYAYSHGVRYAGNSKEPTDQGADTPLAFDLGLTRVPPADPSSIDALADRIKPCDADSHTAHGYDVSPDYDGFWLDRDYLKDAKKIRVPTLVVHGWQDYNVKQDEGHNLWQSLPDNLPWKGFYFWQAPHASPNGGDWNQLLEAFFDKYLLGVDSGLEKLPRVYTQGREYGRNQELQPLGAWAPPTTGEISLDLGRADDGGKLGDPNGEPASYRDAPASSEEAAAEDLDAEGSWLTYTSAPLTADTRIAGAAVLDATITVDRDVGHVVPALFEVGPSGTPEVITRGFLNLRYKDGLAKEVPVPTGQGFRAVVTFKPQDHTVKAGNRIALVFQSSNPAWAVPAPPGLGVTVEHKGASRLLLPVVGAAPPAPPSVPGGKPNTNPVPARASLRISAKTRKRRLTVSGRTSPRLQVELRVLRGRKTVARKRVRANAKGAFKTVIKLRRSGRYTVRAQVRTGEGIVRARARTVRVR